VITGILQDNIAGHAVNADIVEVILERFVAE
jgi:hypothetical protein